MFTPELFEQLLAPAGQRALALAQTLDLRPAARLQTIGKLRAAFPADLAAVALETAVLRERAVHKFPAGAALYWTREALEQASGALVAAHRATRYREWAAATDLCCSVGGDLLALAGAGVAVTGVDNDPVRLAMARANAAALGLSAHVTLIEADVAAYQVVADDLVFFDPARRTGERRVWLPSDYRPPLSIIAGWLPLVRGLGVKVAPGIDYDALPWPCEVEIVSVSGEVKEAALWFGALRRGERRATLLPSGAALVGTPAPPAAITAPQRFIYEPDGAVIRAHLVAQLAAQLDATQIDPEIAFLTAPHYVATPFARAFEISETMPFNLKQLRARLRALGVGQVVVKNAARPLIRRCLNSSSGSRASTA